MAIVEYGDVKAAADRVAGIVRPLTVARAGDATAFGRGEVYFAMEFLQHTGSFKARSAANLIAGIIDSGRMPDAGIVMATGGNADLGFAWAARRYGVPVTVFLAEDAAPAKVARLNAAGAAVRHGWPTKAEAQAASREFAGREGALDAYFADEVLSSAGSGTLLLEIVSAVPHVDTVVVAVGAGGLFAGVAAAADHFGIRVVAAEPTGCRALNAAIAAGHAVQVPVNSIAADSLGALSVSESALHWAGAADVVSVLAEDREIIAARQRLWDDHRLVVEHGTAAPLAVLASGAYRPAPGEKVAVVLCGASTDPSDLLHGPL